MDNCYKRSKEDTGVAYSEESLFRAIWNTLTKYQKF